MRSKVRTAGRCERTFAFRLRMGQVFGQLGDNAVSEQGWHSASALSGQLPMQVCVNRPKSVLRSPNSYDATPIAFGVDGRSAVLLDHHGSELPTPNFPVLGRS